MTNGKTDRLAIVGAGGSQGLECCGLLRKGAPGAHLVAIDKHFSPQAVSRLGDLGAHVVVADVLTNRAALVGALAGSDAVVNLAGPFFRLGTAVLDAAIETKTPYVDICDDVDATEDLLALDTEVRQAGIAAIVGAGAAPGTTNILVRAALDHLGAERDGHAEIAWCAPDADLTRGIFAHLVHCFRTAIPNVDQVPDWDALEPLEIGFPDPIGPVTVVRLGHPEPLTLPRFAGCTAVLRGGMTNPGLLRRAWELARAVDQGLFIDTAWDRIAEGIDAADDGMSGMLIDVSARGRTIRFESATRISMEQSTAVPAAAVALLLAERAVPQIGVMAPECLSPAAFFAQASIISPGGGGLEAFEMLSDGQRRRLSLRRLLASEPNQ